MQSIPSDNKHQLLQLPQLLLVEKQDDVEDDEQDSPFTIVNGRSVGRSVGRWSIVSGLCGQCSGQRI